MSEKQFVKSVLQNVLLIAMGATLIGCAKLRHLEQLLTLKHLSEEKEQMAQLVDQRDTYFEQLRSAVASGEIAGYSTKSEVLAAFGEPVYQKEIFEASVPVEQWLYRYQLKFFDSDKVYLFFSDDKLIRWEYQEVPQAGLEGAPTSEASL